MGLVSPGLRADREEATECEDALDQQDAAHVGVETEGEHLTPQRLVGENTGNIYRLRRILSAQLSWQPSLQVHQGLGRQDEAVVEDVEDGDHH